MASLGEMDMLHDTGVAGDMFAGMDAFLEGPGGWPAALGYSYHACDADTGLEEAHNDAHGATLTTMDLAEPGPGWPWDNTEAPVFCDAAEDCAPPCSDTSLTVASPAHHGHEPEEEVMVAEVLPPPAPVPRLVAAQLVCTEDASALPADVGDPSRVASLPPALVLVGAAEVCTTHRLALAQVTTPRARHTIREAYRLSLRRIIAALQQRMGDERCDQRLLRAAVAELAVALAIESTRL